MPQISETVRRNFDVQVRKVVVVHRPARATEEKVDAAPPRSRRRLSAAEPFLDHALVSTGGVLPPPSVRDVRDVFDPPSPPRAESPAAPPDGPYYP